MFLRYVLARLDDYNREQAYRFYMAESLFAAGEQKHLQKSFREIMRDYDKPRDTRKPEEIVNSAITALGIQVNE